MTAAHTAAIWSHRERVSGGKASSSLWRRERMRLGMAVSHSFSWRRMVLRKSVGDDGDGDGDDDDDDSEKKRNLLSLIRTG